MPITKSGQMVMKQMVKRYGSKKGSDVFYGSINAGKPGTDQWHAPGKKKKGNKFTKALMC